GRYAASGSSSEALPSTISLASNVAVIVLETEPISNALSGPMRPTSSGSAQRNARATVSFSITATAMQAPVRSPDRRWSTSAARPTSSAAWRVPDTASARPASAGRVRGTRLDMEISCFMCEGWSVDVVARRPGVTVQLDRRGCGAASREDGDGLAFVQISMAPDTKGCTIRAEDARQEGRRLARHILRVSACACGFQSGGTAEDTPHCNGEDFSLPPLNAGQ